MTSFREKIPSFRKIIPAALCAFAIAGAAVPASAHELGGREGWRMGGGGFHDRHSWDHRHGWSAGRSLVYGGLGLATGALIADAYGGPVYHRYATYGPTCGETIRTHYDAYGRYVKVVTQDPC